MSIDTSTYQVLVVRKGLEFYAKHGMRINRAYTPKNMMAMASKITGQAFKPRDYTSAIEALTKHLELGLVR